MAEKSEKVMTNREYAEKVMFQLCSAHHFPAEWVTVRQASKYRRGKGRVYRFIKSGHKE